MCFSFVVVVVVRPYLHSRKASAAPNIRRRKRRKHTTPTIVAPPSDSQGAVNRGEDNVSELKKRREGEEVTNASQVTWHVHRCAKVISAAKREKGGKNERQAVSAATLAVMIYRSRCGKIPLSVTQAAAIHDIEQSAVKGRAREGG